MRDPADHPAAEAAEGIAATAPDVVRGGPQVIPRPDGWRPGARAPWAHLAAVDRRPSLADVRRTLGNAPAARPVAVEAEGVRASAVLAPIYEHEGEPHVVLTRRSWDLRSHRGEVSFPGGGWEPGDVDLVATALRETCEEIGIAPDGIEVVGELDHLTTVSSRSFIVPYVGILPGPPDTRPDPREVEEVLHVGLAELLADGVFHEEVWRRGAVERPIWFFELVGDTVWGATAAMLRQLLAVVTGTDPGPPLRPWDAPRGGR